MIGAAIARRGGDDQRHRVRALRVDALGIRVELAAVGDESSPTRGSAGPFRRRARPTRFNRSLPATSVVASCGRSIHAETVILPGASALIPHDDRLRRVAGEHFSRVANTRRAGSSAARWRCRCRARTGSRSALPSCSNVRRRSPSDWYDSSLNGRPIEYFSATAYASTGSPANSSRRTSARCFERVRIVRVARSAHP